MFIYMSAGIKVSGSLSLMTVAFCHGWLKYLQMRISLELDRSVSSISGNLLKKIRIICLLFELHTESSTSNIYYILTWFQISAQQINKLEEVWKVSVVISISTDCTCNIYYYLIFKRIWMIRWFSTLDM